MTLKDIFWVVVFAIIASFMIIGLMIVAKERSDQYHVGRCELEVENFDKYQDYYVQDWRVKQCEQLGVDLGSLVYCNGVYYRYIGGNFHCE